MNADAYALYCCPPNPLPVDDTTKPKSSQEDDTTPAPTPGSTPLPMGNTPDPTPLPEDDTPEPENPCTIFQDGTTAGANNFVPYEGLGVSTTCSELSEFATLFETGSYQCGGSQIHEILCCFIGPEDPCILCPTNGATAGDDFIPVEYSPDVTCADLINSAKLLDTKSDFCVMHGEVIEKYCCPDRKLSVGSFQTIPGQ